MIKSVITSKILLNTETMFHFLSLRRACYISRCAPKRGEEAALSHSRLHSTLRTLVLVPKHPIEMGLGLHEAGAIATQHDYKWKSECG